MRGPDSSVGIVVDYGLDDPGSYPVGTRFSARPDRPCGQPSLLYNGYRGRSVGLTPPPPSSAEGPIKEYSYISTYPKGLRGLYEGWKPS